MGLAEKLSEIDDELNGLGVAPSDLAQRVQAQWGTWSLAAIDQELQSLSTGVTLVDRPSPALLRASVPDAAPAFVRPTPSERAAMPAAIATPSFTPNAPSVAPEISVVAPAQVDDENRESAYPELEAGAGEATPSFADEPTFSPAFSDAPPASASDTPFVPTLPSQPPPAMEAEVGRGERRRSLTMSEPPLSEPPLSDAPPAGDLDPFDGKPAPMPVPQRAPSVWPMAPAPKRTPSRTIRTSAAPPPPLPSASMRPRSIHPFDAPVRRPSDTPDPFAPINRASSRPPAQLDSDQLFGGVSASPPAGEAPVKLSAPPAPKIPGRPPQPAANTAPPAAAEDDFELLVDDEMIEIDVEEME